MANSITVNTTIGKHKVLEARAGGTPVAAIVQMAFGDGGKGWIPNRSDNALQNELLRKNITRIEKLTDTSYRYYCLLERTELQGVTINEMGLVDADGDFVCIIACADKEKDDDIEMGLYVDDIMY